MNLIERSDMEKLSISYNYKTKQVARTRRRRSRQLIYMVTVRRHQVKDFVTVCDLLNVLDHLIIHDLGWASCSATNIVFEIDDTYHQLHLHCIFTSDRQFQYYKYTNPGAYRIHFRKVYDVIGARAYLEKQVKNEYIQDQLVHINHYNHKYGFVK